MFRILSILLAGILTSFFFFPFEFSFLPGINTKMAMAGLGLILLGVNLARNGNALFNKDISNLSLVALVVSLIGLFSVVYNDTRDYTYATYVISMWVWLGGAYVVQNFYKLIHKQITVEIICRYFICVATAQCCIAMAMDMIPVLKNFVDSFLGSTGSMGKVEDRLYGIGASLDVAGSRFSAVLVMIAYWVKKYSNTEKEKLIPLYLIAFFIINFIGSMIARSTIVGFGLALVYWFFSFGLYRLSFTPQNKKFYSSITTLLLFLIPVVIILYNVNSNVHQNMRFAFEGFFSLAEQGSWEVHSNDMLMDMYVFPDNLKTWIIGDGYFDNPYFIDPYYIGRNFPGFYMGTDVGYLRFIFYFGLIGLFSFVFYFFRVAGACMKRFPQHKFLFVLLLGVNFVIWFKVATDIFLVFALFLCISKDDDDIYNEEILLEK